MAKLTFPLLADGLRVDVVVGLDGATLTAQLKSGQPIPAPVTARGEIDTGSNITAVATAILRQLGVVPQYQSTTQTAAGQLAVDVYEVSVGVRNNADPAAAELVEPTLLVMELANPLPDLQVLIGLNFLLGCRFHVDGPGRWFSLEQ